MANKKKGRKPVDVSGDKVEMLSSFGCSTVEIARLHNCSETTIRTKFREEIERGRENMRIKLRQLQWKQAELGNTSLLIFLGKQYLGQSDRNELELVGNLEGLLKECGYEDSPIEKKSFKQTEALEDPQVPALA
jgi:hypothetical protein|tara:strand:+ start:1654 stop:2055 length:402 start_codon:yes stop_codon:yes gene_type:complete